MVKKLEEFIKNNQNKFLLLILAYLSLSILSQLPYFNIIFVPIVIILLLFVLVIVLFKLKEKIYIYFALIFLLLAMVATILRRAGIAEVFGNAVFGLIFLTFLVNFYNYLKNLRLKR